MDHEGVNMAEAKKPPVKSKKAKVESAKAEESKVKKTADKTKAKEVKKVTAKSAEADKIKTEAANGTNEENVATEAQTDEQGQDNVQTVAKAGKRSSKAVKEAEEKQAKEERKAAPKSEVADAKPKKVQKPTRSRLERRSKGYRKSSELIEKNKTYVLKEALELAPRTSSVKFDATVELHVNLNVDPRQADQNIRGTVVLPAGTGKAVKIAVFADEDDAKKAKAAGADIAGSDDFLKQLEKGTIDFDVLISTPANMAKLGKFARLLGPKGLMPNPKSGTVAADVAKAVKEAKAGRVEYRVDSTGIVHVAVGKVSFSADKLEQNCQALIASLKAAKPSSIKGIYIKSAYLSTSMGPSLKVSI